MKHTITIQVFAAAISVVAIAGPEHDHAHDDHKHEHHEAKKTAGPSGGRLVTSLEPHVEIVLTDNRKLIINVINDNGSITEPGELIVTAVGGSRSSPTRLTFTKDKNQFVSTNALPDGNKTPVIVTLKATKDAKPVIERFYADLSSCESCKYKEYACICGH